MSTQLDQMRGILVMLKREIESHTSNSDKYEFPKAAWVEVVDRFEKLEQPTPPPPAGAGTETLTATPRTAEIFGAVAARQRRVGHGAELLCLEMERELTSLRRQAEADRARHQKQKDELFRYYQEIVKEIGGDLIALRAQLDTADKDRERRQTAFKRVSEVIKQVTSLANINKETRKILIIAHDHLLAAMQPSASIDHGERGEKP